MMNITYRTCTNLERITKMNKLDLTAYRTRAAIGRRYVVRCYINDRLNQFYVFDVSLQCGKLSYPTRDLATTAARRMNRET